MSKVKILQFPITNSGSGMAQYVLNNWKYIDKNKFQFDFATLNKKLDFEEELKKDGCKVHYISCYAEDNEEQFIKEMNVILDEDYDVIHLHTAFWKSFLVEEIAKKRGVKKIIVHSHNTMVDILDEEKRNKAIRDHNKCKEEISPSIATDFWACSWLAADWLYGSKIPKNHIKIMNNAIDSNEFAFDEKVRKDYRKQMGLEDCFVLGHVGRFMYQKNHTMLIEVFNQLVKTVPNARLMLIGTGALENELREKVHHYKLDDKVMFLGRREDVNHLMQAMDLFLLPSLFEGLGIVLVEAQAAGLKCLCSDLVPKEAQLTDNIEFLELNSNKWITRIEHWSRGYERGNRKEQIKAAGYNITTQIKVIEQLYETK